MADELITKCLYIDTSVFQYRQFDLKNAVFSALFDLAKSGHAKILTSRVTIGECKKHIEENVSYAVTQRNKFAAEGRFLRRFPEFETLFQKPDKQALTGRFIAEFEEYLSSAKAEHVDVGDANVTEVVEQYFAQTPPFGAGDKKAEFPDAIVLSALAAWCQRNKEEVYVITRDGKMAEACSPESGLHPLEDITDFLDLANEHEDIAADRIKAIFHSNAKSLTKDVRERFRDLDFSIRDYDGDVEVDAIDDVTFGDPEIISIDENQATIEVECEISFTAEVTYEDHDTGMWDSEDQRMYFMDTVRKSVTETTYVSVEILFEYDSLASLADPEEAAISVMSVVRQRPIMLTV